MFNTCGSQTSTHFAKLLSELCECFPFPCCSFWPFLNKVYGKSPRITIEHESVTHSHLPSERWVLNIYLSPPLRLVSVEGEPLFRGRETLQPLSGCGQGLQPQRDV